MCAKWMGWFHGTHAMHVETHIDIDIWFEVEYFYSFYTWSQCGSSAQIQKQRNSHVEMHIHTHTRTHKLACSGTHPSTPVTIVLRSYAERGCEVVCMCIRALYCKHITRFTLVRWFILNVRKRGSSLATFLYARICLLPIIYNSYTHIRSCYLNPFCLSVFFHIEI